MSITIIEQLLIFTYYYLLWYPAFKSNKRSPIIAIAITGNVYTAKLRPAEKYDPSWNFSCYAVTVTLKRNMKVPLHGMSN